jgi:hypothetical protein
MPVALGGSTDKISSADRPLPIPSRINYTKHITSTQKLAKSYGRIWRRGYQPASLDAQDFVVSPESTMITGTCRRQCSVATALRNALSLCCMSQFPIPQYPDPQACPPVTPSEILWSVGLAALSYIMTPGRFGNWSNDQRWIRTSPCHVWWIMWRRHLGRT